MKNTKNYSLQEINYAYAAGIIDGEGCICIYHYIKPNGKHAYAGHVNVRTTTKQLTEWLQKQLGGACSVPKKVPGYKQLYQWKQFGSNALFTLSNLFPYLIVKHRHVVIYLRFYKTILRRKYDRAGLDNAIKEERDGLIEEMHKLAKGG